MFLRLQKNDIDGLDTKLHKAPWIVIKAGGDAWMKLETGLVMSLMFFIPLFYFVV